VIATWLVEGERDRVQGEVTGSNRLRLVQGDLSDPASVDKVVAGIPALRAVVNLVGGFAAGRKVHETEPDAFEAVLRINLRPGFLLARAAMPRLVAAGGAAFVGVSARAALQPFPGAAGYITAKAGVLAFIQALDAEYADLGVRCNAILPSTIDTPANRRSQPAADFSRWVPPEQIAEVVRFLLSPASAPSAAPPSGSTAAGEPGTAARTRIRVGPQRAPPAGTARRGPGRPRRALLGEGPRPPAGQRCDDREHSTGGGLRRRPAI